MLLVDARCSQLTLVVEGGGVVAAGLIEGPAAVLNLLCKPFWIS